MEDKDVLEITYLILERKYLERKQISNTKEAYKVFPNNWFITYTLSDRVEILTNALKNNLELDVAIEKMKIIK